VFDTSISIVSTAVSILISNRSRYISIYRQKCRDMTIPVSISCNRFIVDNCTLRDSNEKKTSHQNHSCKLVFAVYTCDALISVLSKRCISSLLWRFVNCRDLSAVRLMGDAACAIRCGR